MTEIPLQKFLTRRFFLVVYLGMICLSGCQSEDTVIDKYNDLIKKDPKNHQYYFRRGLRYEELNQTDKALSDYTQAIKLAPNEATYHYNRGNVYLTLKDYQTASENFDEAIKLDPENADYYNNKGYALSLLGEHEAAVKFFTLAISFGSQQGDSKLADYYYGRALAYYDMGQREKAEFDYQQVKEFNPEYPYVLNRSESESNQNP